MANGQQAAGGYQNGGGILSLAMRAGRYGPIALFVAALGSLAAFLFPNLRDISDLKQFFAWTGIGIALMGLGAQGKRATDMQVTVAREGKVDLALIANAVTPAGVTIVPTSDDPAVRHEIQTRLSGQHGTIAS